MPICYNLIRIGTQNLHCKCVPIWDAIELYSICNNVSQIGRLLQIGTQQICPPENSWHCARAFVHRRESSPGDVGSIMGSCREKPENDDFAAENRRNTAEIKGRAGEGGKNLARRR